MGLSIHSVPYILPIAALMCAEVSSGLITRTFHQPFSKFLIFITNSHYCACLWLLRGHIHVLYTNFFASQQTGLWLFPNQIIRPQSPTKGN